MIVLLELVATIRAGLCLQYRSGEARSLLGPRLRVSGRKQLGARAAAPGPGTNRPRVRFLK
jgi:hypothetical protein